LGLTDAETGLVGLCDAATHVTRMEVVDGRDRERVGWLVGVELAAGYGVVDRAVGSGTVVLPDDVPRKPARRADERSRVPPHIALSRERHETVRPGR
jgi:hypothetical protein